MTQNYVLPDESAPDPERPVISRLADLVDQELGPSLRIAWVSVVCPEHVGYGRKAYLLDRILAVEYKRAMGDQFALESFLALTDGRNAFRIMDEPVALMPLTEAEEAIRKAALEKLSVTERRVLGLKDE